MAADLAVRVAAAAARLRGLGFLGDALARTGEAVSASLSAYQRWHGLEETGSLTNETERSLLAPRFCGHPDVMPVAEGLGRWPDPNVRWCLANPGQFGGLDGPAVADAFEWAWAQWAAVCGVVPRRVTDPSRAHVLIECAPIDRPGQVLAYSELADGTARQKGQRYDAAESWAYVQGTGVPGMKVDLGRVACHEIGHVLGIPHIAAGNLMQPTYDLRIWRPQAGDAAEARARYGPPVQAPTPPAPTPAGGLTITLTGDITGVSIPGFRVTRIS